MKFSIIIPIYNSARFLKDSIESVLFQSEKDFELILINDGSTDDSEKICKRYRKNDERIIFISKKNEGVSNARNLGILIAQGDYIIFLDADDKLVDNALFIIEEKIQKFQPDVVSYHTIRTNERMDIIGPFTKNKYTEDRLICSDIDFQNEIYLELVQGTSFGIIGNYAVRSNIVKNIRFNSQMIMCEDLLFNMAMFEKANSVLLIPDYLYLYRDNLSGCVHTYNLKKLENKKRIVKEKIAFAEKTGVSYDKLLIYNWFCTDLIYDYWSIIGKHELEKKFLKNVWQDLEICMMFDALKNVQHEVMEHPDFRFVTGTKFERFRLRQFFLLKKHIQNLIKK